MIKKIEKGTHTVVDAAIVYISNHVDDRVDVYFRRNDDNALELVIEVQSDHKGANKCSSEIMEFLGSLFGGPSVEFEGCTFYDSRQLDFTTGEFVLAGGAWLTRMDSEVLA